jgi:hypothetical protein
MAVDRRTKSPSFSPLFYDIGRVHQDDHATAMHATKAIALAADRLVELVDLLNWWI